MTDYNLDVLIQMILDRGEKAKVVKGMDDVEKATKEVEKAEKDATKASMAMARNISKNARLMAKELGELRESAAWIKRGAMPLFQLGVAGFAAIALSARNYINNTKESNEVTIRWAAATQKITDAQMKIGKISAEAILPLLEKAASIAEKTAAFVEKHPGIIEGGLKASIVAAGLGGIGLLVSKGITLYADIKMIAVGNMQLAAAKLMADASNRQLEAAGLGRVTGTGTAAAATGGAAKVGGTVATAGAATATAGGLSVSTMIALAVASGAAIFALSTGLAKLVESLTGVRLPILRFNDYLLGVAGVSAQASQGVAMVASANAQAALAAGANASAANQQASANKNAAGSMYAAASASTSASNGLRQIPSALSGLGTSIGNFFSSIIARITGRAPTHDYTGYAYKGMYAMAQNNQRQFVMSGQATRLAEQMLGGQLNQQAVLASMAGQRGGITINDASNYSAGVGARERRQMRQERLSEYEAIFK